MSFEDDMKENVPGCPKTYDPKHELCKECSLAGDCRRDRLEKLAMDPEMMGKAIAEAQKYADKMRMEEIGEKIKRMPMAAAYVKAPRPDWDAMAEGFLNLFLGFDRKMMEKGINGDTFKVFELFLDHQFFFEGIEPPPPEPPAPPPPVPPTPEEIRKAILATKSPKECYDYATGRIEYGRFGRFEEAEDIIRTSPEFAYKYAISIFCKPWPEAEAIIATGAEWAYKYARNVLGNRWPMAEARILLDPVWGKEYRDYFQIKTQEKE